MWALFKQQRLPAWSLLLTPLSLIKWFILVGIACSVLGVLIAVIDLQTSEITVRYDNVHRCTQAHHQSAFRYEANGESYATGCVTEVHFDLPRPLYAPVYLYYGLTHFYQNHRRFSQSFSEEQLRGAVRMPLHEHVRTSPMDRPGALRRTTGTGLAIDQRDYRYADCVYHPAGLMAWSMFNDSFVLYRVHMTSEANASRELICNTSAFSRATSEPLRDAAVEQRQLCHKKGIAWHTDVATRYRPLAPPSTHDAGRRAELAQHPPWTAPKAEFYGWAADVAPRSNDTFYNTGWYANEPGHRIPVTTDEDLMVWSHVASLPTFRKLFRVIDVDLPAGPYVMRIDEHYDVSSFAGSKSFTLATLSWKGARSTFLTVVYVVTGLAAIAVALILLAIPVKLYKRSNHALAALHRMP